jgi:hypothetical protein
MALWRTTCYENPNNCANHDEISFEITNIIMGCYNYPNNYASCDEMLLEITNITMDIITIQIIVLIMMKQVLKALALRWMDTVTITLYTQCKLHTQSQCKTSTNTHVSYEHKHQNMKEQKYHLSTSYKKWDEKQNALEL